MSKESEIQPIIGALESLVKSLNESDLNIEKVAVDFQVEAEEAGQQLIESFTNIVRKNDSLELFYSPTEPIIKIIYDRGTGIGKGDPDDDL